MRKAAYYILTGSGHSPHTLIQQTEAEIDKKEKEIVRVGFEEGRKDVYILSSCMIKLKK